MNQKNTLSRRNMSVVVVTAVILALFATPAFSGDYASLEGVKGVKAVFDVSVGSPQMAKVIFGAIKEVYMDNNVKALSESPKVAVVFHGPAVFLISSNRDGFKAADQKALDEFTEMIRQMKKDGVAFEVCDYALKVLGVDPATILPEVNHVGNGFISLIGYQAQGYSLVTVK